MFRPTAVTVPPPVLREPVGTNSDRISAFYDAKYATTAKRVDGPGSDSVKSGGLSAAMETAYHFVLRQPEHRNRWSELLQDAALARVAAMYGLRDASESRVSWLLSRWFFTVRICCGCVRV